MGENKYSRKLLLKCPSCGEGKFEYDKTSDSDEQKVKCFKCDYETTKGNLIKENSKYIDAKVSEIGDQIVEELSKELNKKLR